MGSYSSSSTSMNDYRADNSGNGMSNAGSAHASQARDNASIIEARGNGNVLSFVTNTVDGGAAARAFDFAVDSNRTLERSVSDALGMVGDANDLFTRALGTSARDAMSANNSALSDAFGFGRSALTSAGNALTDGLDFAARNDRLFFDAVQNLTGRYADMADKSQVMAGKAQSDVVGAYAAVHDDMTGQRSLAKVAMLVAVAIGTIFLMRRA